MNNLPITKTFPTQSYLTVDGNSIALKPKLFILNGGYIGTKPELATFVEPLLPTGVGNQEQEEDDYYNEIEYSEGGIPILKYPMFPGRCKDCE